MTLQSSRRLEQVVRLSRQGSLWPMLMELDVPKKLWPLLQVMSRYLHFQQGPFYSLPQRNSSRTHHRQEREPGLEIHATISLNWKAFEVWLHRIPLTQHRRHEKMRTKDWRSVLDRQCPEPSKCQFSTRQAKPLTQLTYPNLKRYCFIGLAMVR